VIVRAGAHGLRVRVVGDDSPAEVATIATDLVPLNVGTGALPATAATRTIAYAMVVLLYLSILMNSQNIMSSVAEEKTSRIAEFLVASVSPMQLLGGKILAASATGAAQMAIWASAALIASRFVGGGPAATLGIMGVLTPPVVAGLIAFFLIGFVQYALLYAAAASLISRTEDLGSVAGPLVFPVLLGFVFAEVAALAPNAPQLAILSLVPLISPFVMFTRIVVASAPAWQIVLALAVNLGAIALIARLAGKIYRVGLLTYGRTPKLSQVWATLRA